VEVAVSVWIMELPDPAIAPDTSVGVAIHEKVVPASLPERDIEVADDEHIDCDAGVTVTTGIGFTVITPFLEATPHPPFRVIE
jgi:hypothetical protein